MVQQTHNIVQERNSRFQSIFNANTLVLQEIKPWDYHDCSTPFLTYNLLHFQIRFLKCTGKIYQSTDEKPLSMHVQMTSKRNIGNGL